MPTTGKLVYRLYNLPAGRAKFIAALSKLLADVWDEAKLKPLLAAPPVSSGKPNAERCKCQNDCIKAGGTAASCAAQCDGSSRGTGAFTTTHGSSASHPFSAGSGTLSLTRDGKAWIFTKAGATKGAALEGSFTGKWSTAGDKKSK